MSEPLRRGGDQVIPRPEDWRLAGPPPWASLKQSDVTDLDRLCAVLSQRRPSDLIRGPLVQRPDAKGRDSAVLVALYPGERGATLILTKRPLHMRTHAGEIAFPGGSVDSTDGSLWETALREANEEIGLDPTLATHVGELDRFITGASYSLVQPIVGRLDVRPALVASPDEVDSIIEVPLVELIEEGVYRHEEWRRDGPWVSLHFFELTGETVWGATALMIHNLLELAGSGRGPAS